ncbi:cytochrome P450 [Xylariaceae sp. FL0804]|nr:cytochrome P450 [Xylariaceae sp. FL0804]
MLNAVTAYAGLAILLYYASLFSYRLLLHPLSRYPGPFLARLTDGYAGVFAIARRLHLVTYRDHQKYGPVMRHGPDRLVFNTVEAYRDIYKNENVTKSDVYVATQYSKNVFSILNVRDRAQHRVKRKLLGRAITEQAMRGFEPTMAEQIDVFLLHLRRASQSERPEERVVNMARQLKHLGYDVVGHLAFGYPLDLQTAEDNRVVATANTLGNWRLNVYMQWPRLRCLKIERFSGLRRRLLGLIEKMIVARLAQPKDARRDLFYHVADEMSAEEIRLGNLWSEAVFFIPAGGDTTSTAMSALFFYLSRNPACYAKLAREVRTTFEQGADIRGGPRLSGCRYLRACIDEALRMSPPLPGTLWRELAPDDAEGHGPWVVDGHVVPPGTKVGVNTYALHHNEAYFPDSFAYRPERWMTPMSEEEEPEAEAEEASPSSSSRQQRRAIPHHDDAAFAAFSAGTRGCAGKAMAYLEASLVVARTLWYFDFEVAPGDAGKAGAGGRGRGRGRGRVDEYQLYDVFISAHDGPNLVFRAREGAR